MTAATRRRDAGFTLIEVLVGALVLGIFVSFVYGAVVSAFQVRSVIQTTTTSLSTGTMAVELVARDLENAFLAPMDDLDGFKADEEGGSQARLDFLTTMDSRSQEEISRRMLRSDITEVGYRTRAGEHGLILYRREQFGVDDRPLEGGDYHKVVDGVQEFTVDWFEKDPTEEGESATSQEKEGEKSWSAKEKKRLPRAARITLVIDGPSTIPGSSGELVPFRFTRWVVLPGAFDTVPKAAPPAPGG